MPQKCVPESAAPGRGLHPDLIEMALAGGGTSVIANVPPETEGISNELKVTGVNCTAQ